MKTLTYAQASEQRPALAAPAARVARILLRVARLLAEATVFTCYAAWLLVTLPVTAEQGRREGVVK